MYRFFFGMLDNRLIMTHSCYLQKLHLVHPLSRTVPMLIKFKQAWQQVINDVGEDIGTRMLLPASCNGPSCVHTH